MTLESQQKLGLERAKLLKGLEAFYMNAFEALSQLELSELAIAKLTQLLLQSKEAAIRPLEEEIERSVLTKAPEHP